MSRLVVYDSQYGNTQQVAEAIAQGLSGEEDCPALPIASVSQDKLAGVSLLVVGSPTQGFSATARTKKWLASLPARSLAGVQAAAFDTRFTEQKISEVAILAVLVSIFGYAAKPIASRLAARGAKLVSQPMGFYVADTEGPLLDQELKRAEAWGKQLSE